MNGKHERYKVIITCRDCQHEMEERDGFFECLSCGGELWPDGWYSAKKGYQDLRQVNLMSDKYKGRSVKKKRSSRSGRRRKKPMKKKPWWLINYD